MLLATVLVLSAAHCGGMTLNTTGTADAEGRGSAKGKGKSRKAGGGVMQCPDLMSARGVGAVDFEKEFALDAEAAAKVKAALWAAAELRGLSADIEAELKTACRGLAKQLDEKPGGKSASDACRAAARGIQKYRAKAKGSLKLHVQPPHCSASMDAMADCAAKCDVKIKPGRAKVRCEGGKLSGRCDAECTGRCDIEGSAKCQGECHGSCSARFSGSCGGECSGKCDGRPTNGAVECSGRCEGSCSAAAQGQCGGKCTGSCEIKGRARCSGTCTGECSVEFKKPRCTGEVKPPKTSAECTAHCDAKVNARMKCTPARVSLSAKGAANVKAARKLNAALRAHLPAVLKVSMGMKGSLVKAAGNVKSVVQGVQAGIKGMTRGAPHMAARLTACVVNPFKAAFDASASIKANVSVSAEVSASASGRASARTH